MVTGAGRGIGRAIAETLAAEGTALLLLGRNAPALTQTASRCIELGSPEARTHPVDLSDPEALDGFLLAMHDASLDVDVLVNNAGSLAAGTALAGDVDEWREMFRVNVEAPMRLTRFFGENMAARKTGLIVNIGTIGVVDPLPRFGAYVASKHALRGYSLSCAKELGESNVKVVCIHPGFVDTDMVSCFPVDAKKMIKPQDVASAVKFCMDTSPACVPLEIFLSPTQSVLLEP